MAKQAKSDAEAVSETVFPQVRTPLPGPESAELFERLDRVVVGSLQDHDEVPFVEARKSIG